MRSGTHGTKSLTPADARAIQQDVHLVSQMTPNVDTRVTVVFQDQNWFTQVRGVTPGFLAARSWSIENGRFFSQAEVEYAATRSVRAGEESSLALALKVSRPAMTRGSGAVQLVTTPAVGRGPWVETRWRRTARCSVLSQCGLAGNEVASFEEPNEVVVTTSRPQSRSIGGGGLRAFDVRFVGAPGRN